MSPKAKLAARISIAFGLLVLFTAAFASRNLLLQGYWIRRLDSEDEEARAAAIGKLQALGSARAIPALIEKLREAARAESLEDPEPEVALCAEALLVIIEKRRAAAERAIIAALAADDDGSAAAALAALGEPAVPFLSRSLSIGDRRVRARAAAALSRMGLAARSAFPAMMKAFGEEDAELRVSLAWALRMLGPVAEPAVPVLERTFQEEDDHRVRTAIAGALVSISPVPGEDCCIQLLRSEVVEERERAAELLGELRSVKAVPHLLRALRTTSELNYNSHRIGEPVSALVEIGDRAVPPLVAELKDGDPEIRRLAMEMLAELGDDALSAFAEIRRALEDKDEHVRFWALVCLENFGPTSQEALREIIDALGDPSSFVRSNAMQALGAIGSGAREALPLLAKILENDANFLWEGTESICAIEGDTRTAIPILLRWFTEGDAAASSKAYRALEDIGFKARQGIPGLIPALRHRSASVRMEAVRCLSELWPADPRRIIPALAAALEDAESGIRLYALETLAIIGPEARSALPALQRAREHEDEATRRTAAAAIRRIEDKRR